MLDIILNNAKKNIENIDFSILKNKSILLTGSTGLIGIHLLSILVLLKEKYDIQIYCLVNNDIDKVFLPFFKDCLVLRGDLTNSDSINKLLNIFSEQMNGVDYIIHAAGYGQPKKFINNKINTILLNTKVICELFKLLNPGGSFLYCSTSEIYSGIEEENIIENRIGTTAPDHPRSCYIESKRCGEAIINSFNEKGFNGKIARISLAYGPGTKINDDRVINNFIQKSIQKNHIDMLDSGASIRTYGYISDITEMLWNILLNGKQTVYNVSGISKLSILDLAKKISENIGCEISFPKNNDNQMIGNPKVVNLSLDKYFFEFGKKEYIDIEQGLEETIQWQKGLYGKK